MTCLFYTTKIQQKSTKKKKKIKVKSKIGTYIIQVNIQN